MLQELPGASENFEDCLGPWPLDEGVNYSRDDCGLDSLEALDSYHDLCDLDDGIIEGVLATRYPEDGEVGIRREDGEGDEYSRYHLLFRSDSLIEI